MKAFLPCLFLLTTLAASNIASAQSVADLFEQLRKSVVVITTEQTDFVTTDTIRKVSTQGLGSGVYIDGGLILTAAHVVQTANLVLVKFYDGQEIFGTVISSSPQADVALVRLEDVPRDIPEVQLGDSDGVRIGDEIIVIGAPYGLAYTLTRGIISARAPDTDVHSNLMTSEYFQTDASINHGNSGGPMFDMEGRVVGIVSSILTQSGGFEGIGFAATSNMARSVLIDKSSFWWGVDGTLISGGIASLLNVPQESGYLVQHVADDSPGARLGLIPSAVPVKIAEQEIKIGGDIVLSMQEIVISAENMESIRETASGFRKGDQIRITVLRGGKILSLYTTY